MSRAETAPTTAPPRGRRTAVAAPEPRGRGVTGWTTLLRFALRRERVRIPVWTASVALLLAYVAVALDALYPTAAERQARAALVSSPAGIMLSGPQYGIEDYTLGAMIANEMALTVMVAVAIMSISLVVRHTRAEEETGRAELVRAGVVGRHAPGTAAFAAALVANAAIAVASGAVLSAAGLAPVDSFALGAAVGVTGLVFAAVATVTSQVTEHARAASGLALAVLGVAFLLRAFGDVQELHGSWVSWLSPVGWAQQIRAYVDLRWWPLALSLVLVALLLVLGAALAARRDLGAGLVPPRAGRPDAAGWLASPLALAWRQQRASVLAWGVAVGLTALACGTFVDSVGTMVADNPEIAAMLGDPTDLVSGFVAVMALFLGLGAGGFAVASVQRARGEETSGRLEPVLATGVGRVRWLGGQLVVTLLGMAALLVASALGLWLGALSVGEDAFGLADYLAASFAYLPAVAVVAGVGAAAFGGRPGLAGLAWALLAYSFVVTMFGGLLDLPSWAGAASPFWHVPQLPGADVEPWPFVWLTLLAAALVGLGLTAFRRRDVPRP